MTFLIMWAETRIMSYDGSQLSVCEWSFGCGVRTVCVQSKVYIVSLELRCWVFLSEFSQILIRVFIICVFHIMFYIISCNVIMSVFLLEQQQFFLKIFYKTQAGINVGETKLDEIVMLISQDVRAPCAKMSLQQCIRQVYEVRVSQTHVCRWSRFSRCDLVGSYWPSYNSPVNRRQYQQTRFSWQVKTGGIEQTRPKLILVAYSNQQYWPLIGRCIQRTQLLLLLSKLYFSLFFDDSVTIKSSQYFNGYKIYQCYSNILSYISLLIHIQLYYIYVQSIILYNDNIQMFHHGVKILLCTNNQFMIHKYFSFAAPEPLIMHLEDFQEIETIPAITRLIYDLVYERRCIC
ncbi:Hypothetical_protein [Hexamita inflata]|uniref:Hypothetical_protein n=1 Tax=Hexamita inflata TaxID=28002 RepID=A0AA86NDW8_9EUKA|nr:Hypothetical protein HINF_LOCUS5203 [Hexamita inflata]